MEKWEAFQETVWDQLKSLVGDKKHSYLTPYTKGNSIWITDTNVKSKTIKLKKLSICPTHSPAMPFLSIYVRETKIYIYTKTTWKFIEALL